MKRSKSWWLQRLLVLSVVFVLLLRWSLDENLTVVHYDLTSDLLQVPLRVALLSDLHSGIYSDNQGELIEALKHQQPDLILLAGDIVDNVAPQLGSILLLEGIQNLAPIYYVSGNHEYWAADVQQIFDLLQNYGVRVLSDEYERITIKGSELIVAGIEDPDRRDFFVPNYEQYASVREAFADLADATGCYKILLAHRPERIELYKEFPFDLVVSGHAHGGQVRVPYLLNGLYAPHQGFFPQYAGGEYRHDELTHIVSRGLSRNPRLPRIFNPPELVIIEVK